LFGLGDETVQLAVLLDFHDVVEYSLYFPVGGAVDASYVEVDYLNNVSMFSLVRHLNFVEEKFQALLLVASFWVGFFNLLIHDLYCYSLIIH